MAGRVGLRHVARRFFSSGGKVLSEEEKAAENVYIKKWEKERLEKQKKKAEAEKGKSDKGYPKPPAFIIKGLLMGRQLCAHRGLNP